MRKQEWCVAAAVVAASAGTGFSSGREIVLFFAQMGWASWLGVAFASAMFGVLCGVVCHFAKLTGAGSISGVYMRVLGMKQGTVVSMVHALLMAVTAGVMIVTAGEMAALAIAVRHAFWMGALLSVGIALLLCMRRMRGLMRIGKMVIVMCAIFHVALALDPRSVKIYQRYETVPELSGSVTAALMLSVMHAALNASIAGGVTTCLEGRVEKPCRFGICCGGMMFLLLAASNAALLRGGVKLLSQALPTVVLAARWGVFGYYAAIAVMWLGALTTLAATIGALTGRIEEGCGAKRMSAAVLLLGMLASISLGFEKISELGYPMLGLAGAISLGGLACCFEWRVMRAKNAKSSKKRVKLCELPRKMVDE